MIADNSNHRDYDQYGMIRAGQQARPGRTFENETQVSLYVTANIFPSRVTTRVPTTTDCTACAVCAIGPISNSYMDSDTGDRWLNTAHPAGIACPRLDPHYIDPASHETAIRRQQAVIAAKAPRAWVFGESHSAVVVTGSLPLYAARLPPASAGPNPARDAERRGCHYAAGGGGAPPLGGDHADDSFGNDGRKFRARSREVRPDKHEQRATGKRTESY